MLVAIGPGYNSSGRLQSMQSDTVHATLKLPGSRPHHHFLTVHISVSSGGVGMSEWDGVSEMGSTPLGKHSSAETRTEARQAGHLRVQNPDADHMPDHQHTLTPLQCTKVH